MSKPREPRPSVPQRPVGLSGQEEEELRALEKGYDADAGALPDAGQGGEPDPPLSGPRRAQSAKDAPIKDAEKHGLLPADGLATPPLDRPDDDEDDVAQRDPGQR